VECAEIGEKNEEKEEEKQRRFYHIVVLTLPLGTP
jgi:hypothetical protein